MLALNQAAGKLGFNRHAPVAQMPGCPGGTPQLATMSRQVSTERFKGALSQYT